MAPIEMYDTSITRGVKEPIRCSTAMIDVVLMSVLMLRLKIYEESQATCRLNTNLIFEIGTEWSTIMTSARDLRLDSI